MNRPQRPPRGFLRARLVEGEAPPAAGDVLVVAPSFAGRDRMAAVRVAEVRGRDVWYENVSVDRGPLGAERWTFLPPPRRRAPERLKRR